MKFHEKFKALADHLRLSQADIRRGLTHPVSAATVHNWMSGLHLPTADHAFDIARMLGVPLDLLADDAVDADACLARLRGADGMDPDERIVRDLAARHGWGALLDRLIGIAQAPGEPMRETVEPGHDRTSDGTTTEAPKRRRPKTG